MSRRNVDLIVICIVLLVFGFAASVLGAAHAFLRGFSSIYTSIFLSLAVGQGVATYLLFMFRHTPGGQ